MSVHACMFLCMRGCARCVHACVCIHGCVNVHACVCMCTYAPMHICTCVSLCTHACACVRVLCAGSRVRAGALRGGLAIHETASREALLTRVHSLLPPAKGPACWGVMSGDTLGTPEAGCGAPCRGLPGNVWAGGRRSSPVLPDGAVLGPMLLRIVPVS